ncbi:MAG: hypothetical protein R2862_11335 [Thermoanaerobaculia bacterium]
MRELVLRRSDDFVATTGVHKPESRLQSAELVFVGYGIRCTRVRMGRLPGWTSEGRSC